MLQLKVSNSILASHRETWGSRNADNDVTIRACDQSWMSELCERMPIEIAAFCLKLLVVNRTVRRLNTCKSGKE